MTTGTAYPGRPMPSDLLRLFGKIDIYLFDQLRKGRLRPGMRVLGAGCGDGRNLVYLMRCGFDVFGVESSHELLLEVRKLASRLAPDLTETNFRPDLLESLSFADASFDAVLLNAVLHAPSNEEHFLAILEEVKRVLRPGGILFARVPTTMGLDRKVVPLDGRRFRLANGTEEFLADEDLLRSATELIEGSLLEPIRSVLGEDGRSIGVWIARKVE